MVTTSLWSRLATYPSPVRGERYEGLGPAPASRKGGLAYTAGPPRRRTFLQVWKPSTDTLDHSVLVVDDEPQVVWVLQYSLEAEGYTTLSARDGAAALEAVDLFHPRLMLLDIMMPTLDGWSVLEEIGKLPDAKRPRVVIVSALSSLRDRARAAELGADAFCPKPFNVEDLIGVVHDLEDLDDLDALTGVSDFPAS